MNALRNADTNTRNGKSKLKSRCEWCGKKYTVTRPWQLYDKPKCRKAAFDARRNELIKRVRELTK